MTNGTRIGFKYRFRDWLDKRIIAFKKELRAEYIDEKPINIFKNILLVIIGNILLSFNSSIFVLPVGVITGGNTGIAIIIEGIVEKCGGSLESIGGVNTVITFITIFFFILGLIFVGFDFSLKTIISTIVYPVFIYVFDWLRGLDGMDFLRVETYFGEEFASNPSESPNYYAVLLICGLICGIILGTGVGLAFKGGGSTGGTDALIMAIDRHTKMSASTASFLTDSCIILVGLFVCQDLLGSAVGIFASLLAAIMIGKIFVGNDTSYTASIISCRWADISHAINTDMGRGTTIYSAKGGYTGIERKVISVSFVRDEYRDLLKLIHSFDPSAFVTISRATEVRGVGFSIDDGDEPLKLPEKASKSADSKRAEKSYSKIEAKQEKDIRKHVNKVIKEEKKEEKKLNRQSKKNDG